MAMDTPATPTPTDNQGRNKIDDALEEGLATRPSFPEYGGLGPEPHHWPPDLGGLSVGLGLDPSRCRSALESGHLGDDLSASLFMIEPDWRAWKRSSLRVG